MPQSLHNVLTSSYGSGGGAAWSCVDGVAHAIKFALDVAAHGTDSS
jgi:hypothetical protein